MRALTIILVFTAGYWINSTKLSWAQGAQDQRLMGSSAYNSYNNDPNIGVDQWRLVPYLGWRKFAPVDAYYYDWLKYRKTTRYRYYTW